MILLMYALYEIQFVQFAIIYACRQMANKKNVCI